MNGENYLRIYRSNNENEGEWLKCQQNLNGVK